MFTRVGKIFQNIAEDTKRPKVLNGSTKGARIVEQSGEAGCVRQDDRISEEAMSHAVKLRIAHNFLF